MTTGKTRATTRRGFLRLFGGVALLPVAGLVACSGDKAPAVPAATPTVSPPAAPEPTTPPATEAPAAAQAAQAPAAAGPLTPLEETDPTAVALGYRHDAAQVDPAKHPRFAAGQNCSRCVQFRGQPGDAWGGCNLFPGRAVNAAGWCSGYAARA